MCDKHDGTQLKLNDFLLRKRPFNESNDFLFFAGGELVGYLGMYQFNSHEVELSGMDHPLTRKKGVFAHACTSGRARSGAAKNFETNLH